MESLTQAALEAMLSEAAGAGECLPYLPAFNGNPIQADLSALGVHDLAGKRVLDIGCNIGLRCFQALQAGASEVVGVDVNPTRIVQARSLAARLGLSVEFHCLDADRDFPSGEFDLVLCCGVLEHSRDPAALVARLADAATEEVVLETEGVDGPHATQYLRGLGMRWWERRTLQRMPLMLVGRNGPNPLRPEAKFYFSRPALQRLFLFHEPRFGDVRIVDSPVPGRSVVFARRRRIAHLVVVAGASRAGKTTFINHLHSDATRERLTSIGLGDLADWRVASESDYYRLPASLERLCLHYDMNEAVRYTTKDFAYEQGLALLRAAERVTFLTFWAEPLVLIGRKQGAVRRLSESLPVRVWRFFRHRQFSAARRRFVRRILERALWDISYLSEPEALTKLYEDWFRFCESFGQARRFVVDTTGSGYTFLDVADWDSRRSELSQEDPEILCAG